jgi:glycosyltransferase EpsF
MNMGGAETMVMNLYRAIDKKKIQFDFIVHSDKQGFYDNEIKALGGRIYQIPHPSLMSMKSFKKQLFILLKQNQYSSIHSHAHFFSGFILEVAKKAGVPVRIAHSHTTSDGKKETLSRQIYILYMKYLLNKNVTHRFGCSIDANEALFGKGTSAVVLPNSFDLTEYEKLTSRKMSSDDTLVVGHVGRFDSVKNHSFFIKTFYYFRKIHPNASAILVGDGPEKDSIIRLIKEYHLEDSVTILGIQSDIPNILSSFDVFLFPSLFEGLGNVVLEAQAAGIPCLVSDTVPRAVDLLLQLVTFKSLEDGEQAWAEALAVVGETNMLPSWDERKRKLIENGYDVMENAKYLESIYMGY